MPALHVPVMLREVLDALDCRPGQIYVDCTLGGCGHARAILDRILPDGVLIGIDQDRNAIQHATSALSTIAPNIHLFHGNFIQLPDYLAQLNIAGVDGILIDLGISLDQLRSSGRGFSFVGEEPLDMRMDDRHGPTAAAIVKTSTEAELARIFSTYGEERWSGRIARHIVRSRAQNDIRTSGQLARIVSDAIPAKKRAALSIHPATRVFMALRILVNRELERIEMLLESLPDLLLPGGRLCILSFHSLEDRIVKHKFREWEAECVCPPTFPVCVCDKRKVIRALSRRVVRPSAAEIARNPMARSTRLRACEKI